MHFVFETKDSTDKAPHVLLTPLSNKGHSAKRCNFQTDPFSRDLQRVQQNSFPFFLFAPKSKIESFLYSNGKYDGKANTPKLLGFQQDPRETRSFPTVCDPTYQFVFPHRILSLISMVATRKMIKKKFISFHRLHQERSDQTPQLLCRGRRHWHIFQ